ncbi:MAG: porin family protein [Chitinophagaceae bacterium]|nr:porin family protein [Chitinophagaceae bacterium]
MKSLKIVFFSFVLITLGLPVFAQQQQLKLNLNYSVGIPTGSFKSDMVSNTSFRGWNANLLYGITDKVSLGLEAGFNDYHQKYARQLYDTKSGTVSGVLSNSVQTVPVMLKGRFNLAPAAAIQPYLGAGVGGNFVTYNQYLGEFSSGSKSGLYFAASPEIGFSVPFSKGGTSGITVGGKYNFMPFNYSGNKSLDNWGLFAGINLPLK